MFGDKDAPLAHFPCLSRAVKAADTRHLVPVAYELCKRYVDVSECTQQRLACTKRLADYYNTLEAHAGVHLPRSVSAKLLQDVTAFLLHYIWLARDANDRGKQQASLVSRSKAPLHVPPCTAG